ncbi:MAG: hypothetical protein ABJ308_03940 [Halieaceae bacterium]
MTFRNLKIDHDREPETEAWIEEETREQEERFEKIAQQMDDLKPQRLKWYQQFFDRIRTIGYNMDADDKVQIASADLPVQGDREDQVIWKYGVDSDPRKES